MAIGRVFGPTDLGSFSQTKVPPARFKLEGHSKVDIKEASDVVSLPGGAFIVVGDRSDSAEFISPTGKSSRFKLDGIKNGFSGLEAVTYDPIRKALFVASEEKQELYRYALRFGEDGVPQATLEKTWDYKLKGRDNKGVEGMAYLPGEFSPTGRPQLVMAKEGDPKMLVLLGDQGGDEPQEIDLDKTVKDACKDFSAIAVDPLSGRLFITSDASALLAEVKLSKKGGKIHADLVQALPLRDGDGDAFERVEGVTFDEKGNLFVLLENARKLYELRRK